MPIYKITFFNHCVSTDQSLCFELDSLSFLAVPSSLLSVADVKKSPKFQVFYFYNQETGLLF